MIQPISNHTITLRRRYTHYLRGEGSAYAHNCQMQWSRNAHSSSPELHSVWRPAQTHVDARYLSIRCRCMVSIKCCLLYLPLSMICPAVGGYAVEQSKQVRRRDTITLPGKFSPHHQDTPQVHSQTLSKRLPIVCAIGNHP